MTTKHRRRGLLPPRRPRTITTYRGGLDSSREEILPRFHREAAADDPWLSPMKSEAVRALMLLIAGAAAHTSVDKPDPAEVDLQDVFRDAGLTERQLEVASLTAEGWTVTAIASWLGIKHQTVSQHLHYGRRKLIRQVLPVDTYLRTGVFSL